MKLPLLRLLQVSVLLRRFSSGKFAFEPDFLSCLIDSSHPGHTDGSVYILLQHNDSFYMSQFTATLWKNTSMNYCLLLETYSTFCTPSSAPLFQSSKGSYLSLMSHSYLPSHEISESDFPFSQTSVVLSDAYSHSLSMSLANTSPELCSIVLCF